jgi:phenylalanyl-tRNA synthetase alpha chain
MNDIIKQYTHEIASFLSQDPQEIEQFRIKFLGKKGVLAGLFADFKTVSPEQRKEVGQALNELKKAAEDRLEELRSRLGAFQPGAASMEDLTRPGWPLLPGSQHPLTLVRNEIVDIFARIGFAVADGPEMEDDWHNFSALNFPEEHPARDMQDTFFLDVNPARALRTHTSSVQVRLMESQKPPIRAIMPGRVFRNEAISARAHCIFHQIEGLYIDKGVSFADLKQTLLYFAQEFFGEQTRIRMRPSYFPFTEPSAEVDIWWGLETEADYRITKGTGWLEILGCGMVDPAVLDNCGIDSREYSGYAFGMGIERIAMNKFGVTDLRMFFENDLRFLNQFSSGF